MTRKKSAPRKLTEGWTRRWLAALDAMGFSLSEGPGTVLSLGISGDGVHADLRDGERLGDVTIKLKPIGARAFDRAIQVMAGRASFAASLLSGRIPDDVDEVFAGTSHTLLPERQAEIDQSCSFCLDASAFRPPVPGERLLDVSSEGVLCSHLSAVHRKLDLQLAEDPFLVFQLRGMGKNELLTQLRRHRSTSTPHEGAGQTSHSAPREPLPEPPPGRPESFFRPAVPIAQLKTGFTPPEHPEAVLTRLGPPPLTDPEALSLLYELHRAIGIGAAERLEEWEWRRIDGRGRG